MIATNFRSADADIGEIVWLIFPAEIPPVHVWKLNTYSVEQMPRLADEKTNSFSDGMHSLSGCSARKPSHSSGDVV